MTGTPTPAAARARRHRERLRAGLKVFAVAVDHYAAVDALIRAGYLPEEKAADDAETALALQKFCNDGLKRKRHA